MKQVSSKAALKRLPVGTSLYIVRTENGPMKATCLVIEDTNSRRHKLVSDSNDGPNGRIFFTYFDRIKTVLPNQPLRVQDRR